MPGSHDRVRVGDAAVMIDWDSFWLGVGLAYASVPFVVSVTRIVRRWAR